MDINCPKGLDPDYSRKVCRNCGRAIHYTRGSRGRRGYWQHNSDMAGIGWHREMRSRAR